MKKNLIANLAQDFGFSVLARLNVHDARISRVEVKYRFCADTLRLDAVISERDLDDSHFFELHIEPLAPFMDLTFDYQFFIFS